PRRKAATSAAEVGGTEEDYVAVSETARLPANPGSPFARAESMTRASRAAATSENKESPTPESQSPRRSEQGGCLENGSSLSCRGGVSPPWMRNLQFKTGRETP